MKHQIDLEAARQNLKTWFQGKIPNADDISVSSMELPAAGSSNETFFLNLEYREEGVQRRDELVIRWQPKGFLVFPQDAYNMAQQFHLQRCLADTEVPAPEVLWVEEDPALIGAPFYIMRRVDGWIPGDFPPYHVGGRLFDASPEQKISAWNAALDTIIRIHDVDWQGAGLSFLGVPQDKQYIHGQIAFWERVCRQNADPMPEILAQTRDWLMDNSFVPENLCLCWGDARLGNLIYRDFNVAAALDWEMSCIGDPESDLAWFAHVDWASSEGRPASPTPRLEGLPSIAETIARYEKITGRVVKNFLYYDVFAAWRLAIVYTRIEQDEKYLARSGNKKGLLTSTHFEKLARLIS